MDKISVSKYDNYYSISEQIFDNVLVWAAQKKPTLSREQIIVDIEKILEKISSGDYYNK